MTAIGIDTHKATLAACAIGEGGLDALRVGEHVRRRSARTSRS